VLSMFDPQLMAPTLFMWPVMVLVFFIFWMSHIWTYPDSLPIAMQGSLVAQPTEVTWWLLRSQSLLTLELVEFQR
jgi:hypothetical protein